MENDVEAVCDLLAEGSLLTGGSHALVDLGHPLEEHGDTHDHHNDDQEQEQEVGGHPLLTDLLVGVRPVIGVVCGLEVGQRVGVVLVTVHSLTDTDVSGIEVGVTLQNVGPEVDGQIEVLGCLGGDSVQQDVAVLGSLEDGDVIVGLIQDQHVGALVSDGLDGAQVTQHGTVVTEGEQQVTVEVVGVDTVSLLVDDGPGILGTDGGVDDGGYTGDLIGGAGGEVDLTGRHPEAVTSHDLRAVGVQKLDGGVGTGLILTLDRARNGAILDGRGGNVDQTLALVDGDVVKLSGNLLLRSLTLLLGLEAAPDDLPRGHGNCLRADESGELALIGHNDDTLVGGGGYDVETVVRINGDSHGLVHGILIEQGGLGLLNDALEVTELIEDNDTVGAGIADPDQLAVLLVCLGDEHALRSGELIGHALVVGEGGDGEVDLVVAVQHHDTVVTGIGDVDVLSLVGNQVAGILDGHVQAHVVGIDGGDGGVGVGRIQSLTVNRVHVGLVGRAGTCGHAGGGQDHEECKEGTQNLIEFLHYYIYLLISLSYPRNPSSR